MMISYIIDGSTSQFLNDDTELILDVLQFNTNNNSGEQKNPLSADTVSTVRFAPLNTSQVMVVVVANISIISGHCLYCALCCPKVN